MSIIEEKLSRYSNFKKYLGEDILKRELKVLENKEWMHEQERKEFDKEIGFLFLDEIEKMIKEISNLKGFDKWCNEVKLQNKNQNINLKDLFFELFVFNNIKSENNIIELKRKVREKKPDCFVENSCGSFFIEIKNINEIKKDKLHNKIKDYYKKAMKQFNGNKGIIVIGYNYLMNDVDTLFRLVGQAVDSFFLKLKESGKEVSENFICFLFFGILVKYNVKQKKIYFQAKLLVRKNPLIDDEEIEKMIKSLFNYQRFSFLYYY